MNEIQLAELRRRLNQDPENDEVRARLYTALLRSGEVFEEGVEMAAFHGDPVAISVRPGSTLSVKDVHDLEMISDFPVRRLHFEDLGTLKNDDLRHLSKLPLTDFCIKGCYSLSDPCLQYLKDLPLESLELSHTSNFSGESFADLKGLPLRRLILTKCSYFLGESLAHLASFHDLEELALGGIHASEDCLDLIKS
ncbi:MAG: hypothetical protein P1V97_37905, partial [Planctomycetota bacterium]|nr:hypothetical protein [Planctomycetota bacterium]